tara:strand:+ start:9498 stop:10004 length:507 start_codon:yes stop_codon:yes gene_type:complete
MWFSKASRRSLLAGLVLSAAIALGGCSFTPVYSGATGGQTALAMAYAEPTDRLQQVIYQELTARLGRSEAPTAPLASLEVTSSAGDMVVTTTTNPAKPMKFTVTANLTITARDGSQTPPRSFTRTATANYTRSSQVLGDSAAAQEAGERAARSVAESLRLALLAAATR